MLNEGDCELSFWDYEVDENSEIGEAKRYLKKEDMFKRIVGKLMTLLYSNEISWYEFIMILTIIMKIIIIVVASLKV